MTQMEVDIGIVGSGIAGLWCFRKLLQQGFNVALFEEGSIGGTQTLAAQGMVHGGQRYTLQGSASEHAYGLKDMPKIWNDCLQGQGEIDLRSVKILSDNQIIWAPSGFFSKVGAFLASKSMASDSSPMQKSAWPLVFQKSPSNANAKIYELGECVVDVKSLVQALVANDSHRIVQGAFADIAETDDGVEVTFQGKECGALRCKAQAFIFAAGRGNEQVLAKIPEGGKVFPTQRRPLRQVMVRGMEHSLYGHCITTDPRPRVTITSHPDPKEPGKFVWYMGGIVAERGIQTTEEEAIQFAKKEMQALFPEVNWQGREWATYYVDRAEPLATEGFFKSGPQMHMHGKVATVWPTKLTLAPALAAHLVEWLGSLKVSKKSTNIVAGKSTEIGSYPWDKAKWSEA